jgi:hypothetical protein
MSGFRIEFEARLFAETGTQVAMLGGFFLANRLLGVENARN